MVVVVVVAVVLALGLLVGEDTWSLVVRRWGVDLVVGKKRERDVAEGCRVWWWCWLTVAATAVVGCERRGVEAMCSLFSVVDYIIRFTS